MYQLCGGISRMLQLVRNCRDLALMLLMSSLPFLDPVKVCNTCHLNMQPYMPHVCL